MSDISPEAVAERAANLRSYSLAYYDANLMDAARAALNSEPLS